MQFYSNLIEKAFTKLLNAYQPFGIGQRTD